MLNWFSGKAKQCACRACAQSFLCIAHKARQHPQRPTPTHWLDSPALSALFEWWIIVRLTSRLFSISVYSLENFYCYWRFAYIRFFCYFVLRAHTILPNCCCVAVAVLLHFIILVCFILLFGCSCYFCCRYHTHILQFVCWLLTQYFAVQTAVFSAWLRANFNRHALYLLQFIWAHFASYYRNFHSVRVCVCVSARARALTNLYHVTLPICG